jgi:hypothetical protein
MTRATWRRAPVTWRAPGHRTTAGKTSSTSGPYRARGLRDLSDDFNTNLAYLDFILEPDHEKILIDYQSGMHEEASRGLRERLAHVLDYEIELV